MGKFVDFLVEAYDPEMSARIRASGDKWREAPTDGTKYAIRGYVVTFSPTEVTISKGGEVVWRKPGDFSHPTNMQLAAAKTKVGFFVSNDNAKRTGIITNPPHQRTTEGVDDSLTLPDLQVGDEIRVGKFKNRKATITGFGTDKNGQPILHTTKGDQSLFKPRIAKLMKQDDEVEEDAMPRVIIDKGW